MPIVSIQMPPLPDARRFYLAILENLNWRVPGRIVDLILAI
ncbi:MAG: TniB family NTP-binding protein [Gammaproteobacteria bacterium]|nr:TniB family NTP-binding protein [Gammaproteobacteria bacterium]